MNALSNFVLPRDANGQPVYDPYSAYVTANSDTSGTVQYHLAIDPDGRWKMMKMDTTLETYRFCKGDADYATAWANRASLAYDYPDKVW
jgi:hypothetical protein